MPTPDPPAPRTVYFLVTDPSEEWLLTRFGDENTIALPRVEDVELSSGTTVFADAVRTLLGANVPIRQILPLGDDDAASDWLIELEPTSRSRRGHRWVRRDEVDPRQVEPASARWSVRDWLPIR